MVELSNFLPANSRQVFTKEETCYQRNSRISVCEFRRFVTFLLVVITPNLCQAEDSLSLWHGIGAKEPIVGDQVIHGVQETDPMYLTCRGRGPGGESPELVYPMWRMSRGQVSVEQIQDFDPPMVDRLTITQPSAYQSELRLAEPMYTDSGWYTCTAGKVTREFYVFVDDGRTRNTFLKLKDQEELPKPILLVVSSASPRVPCVMSTPDFRQVQLLDQTGNVLERFTDYDPTRGFYVGTDLPMQYTNAQEISCEVTRDGNVKNSDKFRALVVLRKPVSRVDPPVIKKDQNAVWAFVGGPFQLVCEETFEQYLGLCNWTYPAKGTATASRITEHTFDCPGGQSKCSGRLTVHAAKLEDSGSYTCRCAPSSGGPGVFNQTTVKVDVSPTKGQVRIRKTTYPRLVTVDEGGSATLSVTADVFPFPAITKWYHVYRLAFGTVQRVEVKPGSSSNMVRVSGQDSDRAPLVATAGIIRPSSSAESAKSVASGGEMTPELHRRGLQMTDSGNYTLEISALDQKTTVDFTVMVKSPTSTAIEPDLAVDYRLLEKGKRYFLYCLASGVPVPSVHWFFKPHKQHVYHAAEGYNGGANPTESEGTWQRGSNISTLAETSGTYCCLHGFRPRWQDCEAPGTASAWLQDYIVTDIPSTAGGMYLFTLSNKSTFLDGDSIVILCRLQPVDYDFTQGTDEIWAWVDARGNERGIRKGESEDYTVYDPTSNQYHTESQLVIRRANADKDSVTFKCRGSHDNRPVERSLKLTVTPTSAPHISTVESSPQVVSAKYDQPFSLKCIVDRGTPKPTITWFYAGKQLEPKEGKYKLLNDSQELRFDRLFSDDAGEYRCVARNGKGTDDSRTVTLKVTGGPKGPALSKTVIGLLGAFGAFLLAVILVLIGCLVHFKRQETKRVKLLEQLYTNLMQTARATGENRGSLTYGGLLDPQVPIQEQVENLPYDIRYEVDKKRLQLGQTLGTGQFGKVVEGYLASEVEAEPSTVVAVKMPRNGMDYEHQRSLLSELKMMIYIRRHPNVLGLIGAITKHMVKGELYVIMDYCQKGSLDKHLKTCAPHFVNEVVREGAGENPYAKAAAQQLDGYLTPNSVQRATDGWVYKLEANPDWSAELENRKNVLPNTLATSDLLSYAYQVANGMEYLAGKDLIHRDLAARNVLLTSENVAKICDFGLTRQDRSYKIKKIDIPLPVKWMALESIRYHEYTLKSDVWSFGVLLWEIFSLGEMPFQGVPMPQVVVDLKQGKRLSCPANAPEPIYQLMGECWLEKPEDRPSFTELKFHLANHLRRSSKSTYERLQDLFHHPAEPAPPFDQSGVVSPADAYLALNQADAQTGGTEGLDNVRYFSPSAGDHMRMSQSPSRQPLMAKKVPPPEVPRKPTGLDLV